MFSGISYSLHRKPAGLIVSSRKSGEESRADLDTVFLDFNVVDGPSSHKYEYIK